MRYRAFIIYNLFKYINYICLHINMGIIMKNINLAHLNGVTIPYILKNRILMSPGVWNNYYYGHAAINKAWKKTEWNSRNRALYLDHVDDRTSEWAGDVKNIKFENGNIVGDLYVVDIPTAIKLEYGAKFGVSPKVIGEADNNRKIFDFTFENFSIVINPAVKTTFLNSQVKIKGEKTMPKELEEAPEAEEKEKDEKEEVPKVEDEEKKDEAKKEPAEPAGEAAVESVDKKLAEILTILKEDKEPEDEEKKKKPEDAEMQKKKPEDEEEEEMDDEGDAGDEGDEKKKENKEFEDFMFEHIENSAWTAFVGKYIKANKGDAPVSELMKRAAKEFKKKAKSEDSVKNLEEAVSNVIEEKMSEVLDQRGIRMVQKFVEPKPEIAEELDWQVMALLKTGV